MHQTRINQTAGEYLWGQHNPNHPSWAPFITETIAQYQALVNTGFTFQRSDVIPYKNTETMFQDIARQRLLVYTGGQNMQVGHPLATFGHAKELATVNEVFRAVHDINGHFLAQADFETFDGEYKAWERHKLMYSAEALPALTSETIGQLCLYYSGYGFPKVQKAVILPERFMA